jgi:hypothetical protein
LLEDAIVGLPGDLVKPGDTWRYSQNRRAPGFGLLKADQEGLFLRVIRENGNELAEVRLRGRLSNAAEGAWADDGAGGRVRFTGVTGTVNTELQFDTALGQTRQAKLEQAFQAVVETRRQGEVSEARADVRIKAKDEIISVEHWTPPENPGSIGP